MICSSAVKMRRVNRNRPTLPRDVSLLGSGWPTAHFGRQLTQSLRVDRHAHAGDRPRTGRLPGGTAHSSARACWEPDGQGWSSAPGPSGTYSDRTVATSSAVRHQATRTSRLSWRPGFRRCHRLETAFSVTANALLRPPPPEALLPAPTDAGRFVIPSHPA